MNKLVRNEPVKGIVELKLNRPSKLNAIDFDIMEELKENLHTLRAKRDLKALVITGEGEKAFCSGGDIKLFHKIKTKDEAYHMLSKMGEILYQLMIFPLPTFALINGLALGGGCEIATACDFRIAKQGIKVGFIQGQLGITTGWGGATMLHEKLVYDHAMSILLSAKTITAVKAQSLGFINEIFPERKYQYEAYKFIEKSLVNNVDVLRAYKTVKVDQWSETQLYSRMMSEINRCAELWTTEAHHQAVEEFLFKK